MPRLSKSAIWTSRCKSCRRDTLLRGLPGTRKARFSTSQPRLATAQESPYPYPTRRNPTPHEIFHLPRGATESEIKARYFDLVRLYHPDKALDLSADAAHERFQAITAAYDTLRGKSASGSSESDPSDPTVDLRYQTTAAWRAAHRRRQQDLYKGGAADEKWKDRIILFGVISTIVFVIAHTYTMRKEVIVESLNRSRDISYSLQRERLEQQRIRQEHEQRLLQQRQQQRAMDEAHLLAAPELED